MGINPSWAFWLWTEEDCRRLIATHYPSFLRTYDDYGDPVKKFLAIRYFIVHRFGGAYLDLDLACVNPLDTAAQVAGEATFLSSRIFGRAASSFIMAPAYHPALTYLIHKLPAKARKARSAAAGSGFLQYGTADLNTHAHNMGTLTRVTMHKGTITRGTKFARKNEPIFAEMNVLKNPCSARAFCALNASEADRCPQHASAWPSALVVTCAQSQHGLSPTLSGLGSVEATWNSTHICSSKGCFFLGRPEDSEPERRAAESSGSFALPKGKLNAAKCPSVVVMAVSDGPLAVTSYLKRTATVLGVPLAVPYLPLGAQGLRRGVYARTLERMEACADTAVLLVDAHDTFLRCNASEISQRVHGLQRGAVLVSAEAHFKFQDTAFVPEWEILAARYANGQTPSTHRFLNGGGIGGRVPDVSRFARAAASLEPPPFAGVFKPKAGASDQNPTATTVLRDAREGLGLGSRLDYDSKLFYTATFVSGEVGAAEIEKANSCIVHVPGKGQRKLLDGLVNLTAPRSSNESRKDAMRADEATETSHSKPQVDDLPKVSSSLVGMPTSSSDDLELESLKAQEAAHVEALLEITKKITLLQIRKKKLAVERTIQRRQNLGREAGAEAGDAPDLCANASYVTLLTGARYAAPAGCLPAQLRLVRAACPIYLVFDDEDETLQLPLLRAAYGRDRLVPLSTLKARYERHRQQRWAGVATGRRLFEPAMAHNTHQKLWLWALPFKKVVFIDIDTLILGNVDSLLSVAPPQFMLAKHSKTVMPSIGSVSCWSGGSGDMYFNSGVMVLTPSLEVLSVLLRVARFTAFPFKGHVPHPLATWPDVCSPVNEPQAFMRMFRNASSPQRAFNLCRREHSRTGEHLVGFIHKACESIYTDQSILNYVFSGVRTRLPAEYNDYNRYKVRSARIIHFVGEPKPWSWSGRDTVHGKAIPVGRLNASRLWSKTCRMGPTAHEQP